MKIVHRIAWEIDGKRFVSPIAWEDSKDAQSAARQAQYAMREAGITDSRIRFVGLEASSPPQDTP